MAITGTTIEARATPPTACVVLAAIGTALAAGGVAMGNPHLVMTAVMPLVLAGLLWARRPKSVQLLLEDRGLRVLNDGRWILYENCRSATVRGAAWIGANERLLADPIVIDHVHGQLIVPPRMNVPAKEFYDEVVRRIPPQPPRPLPSSMADYYAAQVAKFGEPKVIVVHSRQSKGVRRLSGFAVFVLTLILCCVAWASLLVVGQTWFGSKDDRDAWIGVATLCGVSGVLMGLVAIGVADRQRHARKKGVGACIVLGPAGMAMFQADMLGSLRWDEVTGVKRHGRTSNLAVAVRGATIIINDLYERSVDNIAAEIRRNLG
jgi:hypothetical protein